MSMTGNVRATGSCLCGAVRFAVRGGLRPVVVCHCLICQRSGSAASVTTACSPEDLVVLSGRPRWLVSSPGSRRGFCAKCGSQLFWESGHGSRLSISAGSLDQPTGLRVGEHIFTEHRADYDRQPPLPAEEVTPWTRAIAVPPQAARCGPPVVAGSGAGPASAVADPSGLKKARDST